MSEEFRRALIHEVARRLDEQIPGYVTGREAAADAVRRMISGWIEIHINWDAEAVGLGDTPEERAKWEEAFLTTGQGLLLLAGLIVEMRP